MQFDLPDGTYAYGGVLRHASVAFYRRRSDEPRQAPVGDRDFEVVVGVYDDVVNSHPVVGSDQAQPGEDEAL